MAERTHRILRLVTAVLLLTLLDAAFSVIGMRLGLIGEANPLLRGFMEQNPELSALAACLYTAALMAVVRRFGPRCRCTVPLLYGLCGVKAAVIGLHIGWILTA